MLHILPTEILIQIFLDVDYLTLKISLGAVCRRLRDVILDAEGRNAFAHLLFKAERPGTSIAALMSFQLHPCLALLTAQPRLPDQDSITTAHLPLSAANIGFRTQSGSFLPLSKTPVASENATHPACDFIDFYVLWPGSNPNPASIDRGGRQTSFGSVMRRQANRAVTVLDLVRQVDGVMGWGRGDDAPTFHMYGKRLFSNVRVVETGFGAQVYFEPNFAEGVGRDRVEREKKEAAVRRLEEALDAAKEVPRRTPTRKKSISSAWKRWKSVKSK